MISFTRFGIEAIVLFITSRGKDRIVEITLFLNSSYVSLVICDLIACLPNASGTSLKIFSIDFLGGILEDHGLHGP
jgi:hypothetical protein